MNALYQSAFDKAEDSFESAVVLFESHHYPGSVNRCYYAMYYIVSALVNENRNKHIKTHNGLIRIFSEEFIKTGKFPKPLLITFKKILEKRQVADYDIYYNITEEETKSILNDTKEFIATLRKIVG